MTRMWFTFVTPWNPSVSTYSGVLVEIKREAGDLLCVLIRTTYLIICYLNI